MGDLTENFSRSEFACRCGCGFDDISRELVVKLQKARDYCSIPMKINSACRCEEYNNRVGGSPTSSHKKGLAADIDCGSKSEMYVFLKKLLPWFQRIGIYQDELFIHVDVDPDKTSPIIW